MKINKLWAALLLPLMCACQSEAPLASESAPRKLKITASLPDSPQSRAQITYGNTDREKGEIFKWNEKDYIQVFNISRLDECPLGVQLEITKIEDTRAEFESIADYPELKVYAGDILFVNYGVTERKYKPDATFDDRNIFTLYLGTEANKPQMISENPNDQNLEYMKDNLKMYDIVKVEQDEVVPELHFKHLSAIVRVTLRNATGKYIYPTKLEFEYPSVTGVESFYNVTFYCGVIGNESEGYKLRDFVTDDLYTNGSKAYTNSVSTTINGKNITADIGDSIPDGKSYELYLTPVPRIENDSYGNSVTISLIKQHDTDHPYSITLDGFDKVIEAGKRYWFDLTATPEGTLVLSSKYKPNQENNGEETTEP